MIRFFYRKYWDIGFRLGLYDLLAPQAYLDSIGKCAEKIKINEDEVLLDAGCGSGLSLLFLKSGFGLAENITELI